MNQTAMIVLDLIPAGTYRLLFVNPNNYTLNSGFSPSFLAARRRESLTIDAFSLDKEPELYYSELFITSCLPF